MLKNQSAFRLLVLGLVIHIAVTTLILETIFAMQQPERRLQAV